MKGCLKMTNWLIISLIALLLFSNDMVAGRSLVKRSISAADEVIGEKAARTFLRAKRRLRGPGDITIKIDKDGNITITKEAE